MKLSRPIGRMFVVCFAAGVASACSLLIDVSGEQCSTDADCVARGASFAAARCVRSACVVGDESEAGPIVEAGADAADASPPVDPRYLCLGKHPAPVPTKATAAYEVTMTDLLSTKPIADLRVKLCTNLTDPNCSTPAQTTKTDAMGVARFTIDVSTKAFDGYIDVLQETGDGGSPTVDGGDPSVYMPSRIYYTSIPISGDLVDNYQLLTFGTLSAFGSLFQSKVDFSQGSAFIISEDCNLKESAGISLQVDQTSAETRAFYLQNDQPSTTATASDISGVGGYINLPPGNRRFNTRLGDAAVTELNGYVRPATIMFATVGPAYTP